MGLRKPCGHGPLCTRLKCREPKPLVINDCPICKWGDGTHNSSCWIGALAIKWREAEANFKALAGELAEIRAALADGGVMPQELLAGVQIVVRERAEYSRKYHEAQGELGKAYMAISDAVWGLGSYSEWRDKHAEAIARAENSGTPEGCGSDEEEE